MKSTVSNGEAKLTPPVDEIDAGGDGKQDKTPEKTKEYTASIFCSPRKKLPQDFSAAILELEKLTGRFIFLLVQSDDDSELDDQLAASIMAARKEISERRNVTLLLDSGGGVARAAYKIARIFKGHCDSFEVLVPRWAKSAATLLSLGADNIILGNLAELGPLDAQYWDAEREDTVSALDDVQALERLQAFSMDVVDRTMFLLLRRASKKVETLLPMILKHAADLVRPLFERIDSVHYTQMSRALKVAEEYAIRLLEQKYSKEKARLIAHQLVENYPEHGFVVDAKEARAIGLEVTEASLEQQSVLDILCPKLMKLTAVGFLKEVDDGKE